MLASRSVPLEAQVSQQKESEMWILPPSKEQMEKQEREITERMAKRHAEQQEQSEKKDEWLKVHTCPHCGQHPPLPPWFVGY